jgi:LytS/YehU family sensor histidine kinase
MLNYRYEALRNQINPHFLFNSFNVLSDLVYEDQDLAVKFIGQLSDLYRYVLDSREKELVPLKEELDFIESYIFLLQTRFEDKINIKMDLSPQADEMIVPMTLQLLIENAVKHNEASKKHPLQITVVRKDGKIEVRNGLKIRSVGDDSKQTGLKNISQQYQHLSTQETDSYRIEIEQTAEEFIVRVPILNKTPA